VIEAVKEIGSGRNGYRRANWSKHCSSSIIDTSLDVPFLGT